MHSAAWPEGEFESKQRDLMDKIEMLTPGMSEARDKSNQEMYERNWAAMRDRGTRRK